MGHGDILLSTLYDVNERTLMFFGALILALYLLKPGIVGTHGADNNSDEELLPPPTPEPKTDLTVNMQLG